MKEKAEKDIAQEKRKAVNEIKGEIGGMAVEIAGKSDRARKLVKRIMQN